MLVVLFVIIVIIGSTIFLGIRPEANDDKELLFPKALYIVEL